MMNGIMTIVSDAAGIAHYIEHGKNGMVFKSEDSHHLANMIEWAVLNDKGRIQIGSQGRGIYDEFFSINEHDNNLRKLIR